MTLHTPIIVHHQAALDGAFPPNSLPAIRACLEAGAACIEVDVLALADDDYLLVHDFDLDSETTGSGPVADLPAAAARGLRYRRGDGQTGDVPVALLSEVVALLLHDGSTARLQLDFKNVIPFRDDEPLRRFVRLIEPLGRRVIVSSNADWQLRRLHRLAPWLDLGFDIHFALDWRTEDEAIDPRVPPYRQGAYGYWDDHPLAMQRFYPPAEYLAERCAMMAPLVPGVSTFYINHRLLAGSLDDGFNWAEALHEYGIQLTAWTLDTDDPVALANARRLLTAGVNQFTTNTPRQLAATLTLP